MSGSKKILRAAVCRANRIFLVERPDGDAKSEVSLVRQAQLLSLARSSLYYQKAPPSEREIELKHQIDRLYTDYPFYGSRRMVAALAQEGVTVNRRTVQQYMREMGLEAIYPGPNLSRRSSSHRVYPYLLRNVIASYPNHVWGILVTYLPLTSGWIYLVAVLDWYSRYVVSWELSPTLHQPFVTSAVSRALAIAQPVIFNSDQGSHFTSPQYTELILAAGSKVSRDGKGRALDNIFTERQRLPVKRENVYLADYRTLEESQSGLKEYFDFYDFKRPHQSLGYQTPAQIYFAKPPDASIKEENSFDSVSWQ